MRRRGTRGALIVTAVAVLAQPVAAVSAAPADAPAEQQVMPAAARDADDWLGRLNAARANAGLGPVVEEPAWSDKARLHARFMLINQVISHTEDPSLPGASEGGRWAARTGNLHISGMPSPSARPIDRWLNSPGHAAWVLNPRLERVGFGDHTDTSRAPWRYAAVLPVVDGLAQAGSVPARITYPGHGSTLATGLSYGPGFDTPGRSQVGLVGLRREGIITPVSRYEVLVEADGRPVAVEALEYRQGWLMAKLVEPLPQRAEVAVLVLLDGRFDDRWTFTLHPTASAPPIAGQVRTEPLWDVPGTTHADAILALASAGVLGGFRDGSFRPLDPVSRGQVATLLDGVLDLPPLPGPTPQLSDVDGSAHAAGIRAVVAAGVMAGRADGRFDPSGSITRGQLATALTAALDLPAAPGLSAGSDVAGSVHRDGIRAAVAAGLMTTYGDGTFRPGMTVPRGQLATVLVRGAELAESG